MAAWGQNLTLTRNVLSAFVSETTWRIPAAERPQRENFYGVAVEPRYRSTVWPTSADFSVDWTAMNGSPTCIALLNKNCRAPSAPYRVGFEPTPMLPGFFFFFFRGSRSDPKCRTEANRFKQRVQSSFFCRDRDHLYSPPHRRRKKTRSLFTCRDSPSFVTCCSHGSSERRDFECSTVRSFAASRSRGATTR